MKTDDLISMLSTNVERIDRGQVERMVTTAAVIGSAVVLAVTFVLFGVRTDFNHPDALTFLPLKLAFTIAVVVPSSLYLVRLARPGGELRTPVRLLTLPFVTILLLAAINLGFAPAAHWKNMFVGDQWLECLLSIPIIAIVPFVVIVWAVRRMAPTDLTRTGALAGLLAGGVSATGYALHCTGDSLPFIALWYGGTIALCTLAGAKLGPRLLRW
jgi:hypothetical protein